MKFCKNCQSLLHIIINNNELKLQCYNCKTTYISSPEDTLLTDVESISNVFYDDIFVKNAFFDQTSKIIEKICTSCNRKYQRVIRMKNMTALSICYCKERTIDFGDD